MFMAVSIDDKLFDYRTPSRVSAYSMATLTVPFSCPAMPITSLTGVIVLSCFGTLAAASTICLSKLVSFVKCFVYFVNY